MLTVSQQKARDVSRNGHGALSEILRLADQHTIGKILEIGARNGGLVDFLIDMGFQTHGVDPIVPDKPTYTAGWIQEVADSLDTDYDLIFANNVLSQNERVVSANMRGIRSFRMLRHYRQKSSENSRAILDHSLSLLRPGGLFLSYIDIWDVTAFTEEDARRIGYDVLGYNKKIALLQKPQ